MRSALLVLLALAACRRAPDAPASALAGRLPATTAVLAGVDVDRLRATPLFPKLPDAFRDASYVIVAFDGPAVTTATRTSGRIAISGPSGAGAPADLVRRAPAEPLWIVARGDAALPLSGNLANLNRLLRQTDYTIVAATVSDRVQIRAEALCRTPAKAQHLEENVRALGTLFRLPLDVARDGAAVRVSLATSIDAVARLL